MTLETLRVPGWDRMPWLRHGFSLRAGGCSTVYGPGELNLGFTPGDDAALVAANRRAFVEALGGGRLATMRQVHSNAVRTVKSLDSTPDECDGLIADTPGILLGVLTADCVPVLVVDPTRRAVGGFHAGWRGTVARIVELGVARMNAVYGSRPEDLQAAIGPAIGACCYIVGDELRARFAAEFAYAPELFSPGPDGLRVDLAEANRRQLLEAGVKPGSIWTAGECTACARLRERRRYFSHRAEGGFTGRMMSAVGLT
jgi:YfiH family protein